VRSGARPVVEVVTSMPDEAAVVLASLGLSEISQTSSGVRGTPFDVAPERIVEALVAAGVGVRGFALQVPSLEDLFVALTGEGFDVSR
jgi:ABC-2 type transport system ATP-binding protein